MANPFLLIILIAVILKFVTESIANLLNLKALKVEPPTVLQGFEFLATRLVRDKTPGQNDRYINFSLDRGKLWNSTLHSG